MKLYWSPRSPYVRKVMIAAHETGVSEQLALIRAPVATTKINDLVMGANPLNKIPTLELDDGRVLYDSNVIVEYFHSINPECALLAGGGAERWDMLRRRALGDGFIDLLIVLRNERERAAPSAEHIAAFDKKIDAVLNLLESELDFLSHRAFGVDQISIGCALGYADFRFAHLNWRQQHPHLRTWFENEFQQRNSVQRAAHFQD